ncbi:hypothetical protein BGX21_006833 [Mortierella sp. AD011]|nr:hypothetical protein BGX20_009297 [Mortierella sp. AD010]KAF9403134.1 hypothetical protein BGX21_006833 [Mortierella sp. AD011]
MRLAKDHLKYFLYLFVQLVILAKHSITPCQGEGLVAAQKELGFFKQAPPDLENIASETLEEQQRQAIEKTRALYLRKEIGKLLEAMEAESLSDSSVTDKKVAGIKESKKPTGHDDHVDNEAYGGIVWYDRFHREDEEEHEEQDDHHHDDEAF